MPTRNINLTEHLDQFIDEEVKAGRYRNASEVTRAGLRLLEQRTREDHEKLALLRTLAAEAFQQLDQGQGLEIRSKRELADLISGIGRRAAKSVKRGRKGA
jgi:antitoxin ParD1/3/4